MAHARRAEQAMITEADEGIGLPDLSQEPIAKVNALRHPPTSSSTFIDFMMFAAHGPARVAVSNSAIYCNQAEIERQLEHVSQTL